MFGGRSLLILLASGVPERFGSLKLLAGTSERSLAFSQKITWDEIEGAMKGAFHDTFIGVLEKRWGLPRAITGSLLFRVQLAPLKLLPDVLCLRAPRAVKSPDPLVPPASSGAGKIRLFQDGNRGDRSRPAPRHTALQEPDRMNGPGKPRRRSAARGYRQRRAHSPMILTSTRFGRRPSNSP